MTRRPTRPNTPGQLRRRRRWGPLLWALLPAMVLDAAAVSAALWGMERLRPEVERSRRQPVRLVLVEPPEEREDPPDEDDPLDVEGQLVDVAPPQEEQRPEQADYLAEHDQVVEEETKSERFEINPEVLAKQWSRDQQLKSEVVEDLDITEESTGAQVGNDRFDPDRHGALASLPSPWRRTNLDGLEAPTVASSQAAAIAGAPQNDLLDERSSDQVNLNTKKFLYAGYINRIRQLVNFYWAQNLDNLPPSVQLTKDRYRTVVDVVLDADGNLEVIEVSTASGSAVLDDAVLSAFKLAGPFPHPPEGLIEKDGRVYLPDFGFDVKLGVAQNRYQGVDPRAGVLFPGILKSPR